MNIVRSVLTAALLAALWAPPATAEIPQELAWQGVVLDSNNIPLSDGVYTFHFAIFPDDVGGSPLWQETQAVTVASGVLNVLLGQLNPIPDSAFSGPARFLQVQFETQAPYVPRTRIVSVGYAFRTASVDGARSGQLSGDLNVSGGVTASSLSVAAPEESVAAGSLGSLEAHPAAEGGVLGISDEQNQLIVYAGPDPDGEGGQISVSSNPLAPTGILLEGNSDNSGEPHFAIVGSTSMLDFDLKPGGDISLVLPPGAISADQILDEAGLAAGVQPGSALDIQADYRSLAAATATFPADGYALVIAEATFRGKGGEEWIDGQLLANGAPSANWYWDAGDYDPWFDQRQTYVHARTVTAGTHTFELQVRQGEGVVDAIDGRVTVLYVPTAYGLIASSDELNLGGPPVTVQLEPSPVYDIDLEAERTAAVAANQARIEAELSNLAARLAALQAELALARATAATETEGP